MDLVDGNGVQTDALTPITFNTIRRWADVPYRDWVNNGLPAGFDTSILPPQGSFFSDIMDAMGSSSNPEVMTNLDGALNRYKATVVNTDVDPVADDVFDPLAESPTRQNTAAALTLLRQVLPESCIGKVCN
jgi:hypothetical protein